MMLKHPKQPAIDTLVSEVLASSKYKDVCPALILTIAAQELGKRRNLKEALKATKNKLHQVGGAYQDGRENYPDWLTELKLVSQAQHLPMLKQACQKMMSFHASTRERLPILDQFYSTLLAELPPIHSVLDIACGLHPLALPWMPLAPDATYQAYDIYQNMMNFLSEALTAMQINGQAYTCDVIQDCPTQASDLAFVLKVLPCLEQVDKQASYQLLRQLNARYLIVSFPIQSLGGRHKGMASYYENRFYELVEGTAWRIKRFEFSSELVFLIEK